MGGGRGPLALNLKMDFELSEEQRSLRQSIVEFARRELNEDVVQRDKAAAFSREAWGKCADLGLLGLPVPKEYGGVGADVLKERTQAVIDSRRSRCSSVKMKCLRVASCSGLITGDVAVATLGLLVRGG